MFGKFFPALIMSVFIGVALAAAPSAARDDAAAKKPQKRGAVSAGKKHEKGSDVKGRADQPSQSGVMGLALEAEREQQRVEFERHRNEAVRQREMMEQEQRMRREYERKMRDGRGN
jgi:hypothetical protein